MEFLVGWARLQLILYTQLAAVTGNWLDALTQLRYHDLVLTLVRDPHSGTPRLCVVLITHFTKAFLGMKDVNTFRLPEIIYDPTLVLSPHVFLLGMLFHIEVFKSPSLKTPERLYSLRILDRLNQQELPLRDDLANKFIFCMVVREGDGVRIAHERQLTTSLLRNCMKRGGKITGLDQVMKLYVLRDGAAKAFNKSREYPPVLPFPLAAPILSPLTTSGVKPDAPARQYQYIPPTLYGLEHHITIDVLSIYCGLKPQKVLMRMLCSMSQSINPRRPWKLTPE
ncbi:hypothetical protein ACO22_00949 [Paracoccidioides brasiliensis]|uniref:Uncharacterized protein n=1 Tax=Paracoccidioides brasiliensis TaxID=121759 RepID=A0A1D2JMX4_PARBR|nr:hypothetical protein ACO22_00949 [Paracoccidioides brasiliensis]